MRAFRNRNGAARALRTAAPWLIAALASLSLAPGPGVGAAAAAPPGAAARGDATPARDALPVLDDLRGTVARAAAAQALPLFRARGALPSAKQTTVFAAGSVAVSVIFVESDGSIDRSREDWSRRNPRFPGDRRANVLAQVEAALGWWERALARRLSAGLPPARPASMGPRGP